MNVNHGGWLWRWWQQQYVLNVRSWWISIRHQFKPYASFTVLLSIHLALLSSPYSVLAHSSPGHIPAPPTRNGLSVTPYFAGKRAADIVFSLLGLPPFFFKDREAVENREGRKYWAVWDSSSASPHYGVGADFSFTQSKALNGNNFNWDNLLVTSFRPKQSIRDLH